jgi:hypothetical protein
MKRIPAYLVICLLMLVVLNYIGDPHSPTIIRHSIGLLFTVGLLVLISLVWVARRLQNKRVKRKTAQTMKDALEKESHFKSDR